MGKSVFRLWGAIVWKVGVDLYVCVCGVFFSFFFLLKVGANIHGNVFIVLLQHFRRLK